MTDNARIDGKLDPEALAAAVKALWKPDGGFNTTYKYQAETAAVLALEAYLDALARRSIQEQPDEEVGVEPLAFGYTNWRGEYSERRVMPQFIHFGATEWHVEPQWLLTGFDLDKNADRDFALKDFGRVPDNTDARGAQVKGLTDEMVDAAAQALWDDQVMVLHWKTACEIAATQPDSDYVRLVPLFRKYARSALEAGLRAAIIPGTDASGGSTT